MVSRIFNTLRLLHTCGFHKVQLAEIPLPVSIEMFVKTVTRLKQAFKHFSSSVKLAKEQTKKCNLEILKFH